MKTKTLEAAKEKYEELLYRYARYLLRRKGVALSYVEEVFNEYRDSKFMYGGGILREWLRKRMLGKCKEWFWWQEERKKMKLRS